MRVWLSRCRRRCRSGLVVRAGCPARLDVSAPAAAGPSRRPVPCADQQHHGVPGPAGPRRHRYCPDVRVPRAGRPARAAAPARDRCPHPSGRGRGHVAFFAPAGPGPRCGAVVRRRSRPRQGGHRLRRSTTSAVLTGAGALAPGAVGAPAVADGAGDARGPGHDRLRARGGKRPGSWPGRHPAGVERVVSTNPGPNPVTVDLERARRPGAGALAQRPGHGRGAVRSHRGAARRDRRPGERPGPARGRHRWRGRGGPRRHLARRRRAARR